MHPTIFQAFETICRGRPAGDVLEVGAVRSNDSLLTLRALRAAHSKIGVNLCDGGIYQDFRIVEGNANRLAFADATFDTVLCNSVLEHDPRFWLTLHEMKRVARPGALIAIGVPGFTNLAVDRRAGKILALPLVRRLAAGRAVSTLTLRIHRYPGDYYRFSPEAVRDVFLEGLRDISIQTMMVPPRIIGSGVKT